MYTTVEALRSLLGRPRPVADDEDDQSTDESEFDAQLAQAIAAACQTIDSACGWTPHPDRPVFAAAEAAAEPTARIYAAGRIGTVDVHPFIGTPTVETSDDRTTWSTAAAWPEPDGAAVHTSVVGVHPFGRWVRVTARWGYPATPDAVAHAALILAGHLHLRRDSIDGTIGGGQLGAIRVSLYLDPDVERALAPYRRYAIA